MSDMEISEDTGLHVHFSRDYVTNHEADKFAYLLNHNEGKVTDLARREPNGWATFHPNMEFGERPSSRFSAVNFENYNTIEVRVFKSTLDEQTLMHTLQFVDAAVEFAKVVDMNTLTSVNAWSAFLLFAEQNAYSFATA